MTVSVGCGMEMIARRQVPVEAGGAQIGGAIAADSAWSGCWIWMRLRLAHQG